MILLSLGLISGRSKFYGFFVLATVMIIYFSYTTRIKFNFKTIFILILTVGIMLVAVRSKIELYFIQSIVGDVEKNEIARYVLYATSFDIFQDYFPLGSGFASFGTFYSGEYYSSIYEQYGIDNVWGMMKNEHSFIADTYYPSLAQFGITGVILYALFWFYLLSKAFRFYRQSNNAKEFILFLLIICYFVIESIADSTYTTHRGFFIMMLLGLISSSMKTEIKNIKADENFTNR